MLKNLPDHYFKLFDLSPSVRLQCKYGELMKVWKAKTDLTIWHQLVFEPDGSPLQIVVEDLVSYNDQGKAPKAKLVTRLA